MVEARQRDQWQHTAQVLCLVANCNRDEKRRSSPYEPWEFHPLELRDRRPVKQRIPWKAFEGLCGLDPDEEE